MEAAVQVLRHADEKRQDDALWKFTPFGTEAAGL
jgi:hypothetical protein